jgi:transcriptional regulator with XRE-family HTH domain
MLYLPWVRPRSDSVRVPRRRDERVLRSIGRRFQKVRKDAGWTQEQLAEALDIQPITLSRWERGERAVSLTLLARSAALLDVTLADLLDTARPAPPAPPDPKMAEVGRIWLRLDDAAKDLAVRLLREVAR